MTTQELYQERAQVVADAIALREPKRVPICPFIGSVAQRYHGSSYRDLYYDYDRAGEAAVQFYREHPQMDCFYGQTMTSGRSSSYAATPGLERAVAEGKGKGFYFLKDASLGEEAYTIDLKGEKNGELSVEKDNIQLVDKLKPQNKAIKAEGDVTLPVYIFKGGRIVIPIYGAGLWGPVWGYIAFEPDCHTIAGAYFDHEGETPGLGAKIKDEPWFREKFAGKTVEWGDTPAFRLEKNAEATGATNAVDAITGATMTSKGLNEALNVWFGAYGNHLGLGAFFNMLEEYASTETPNAEEE